MVGFLTFQRLHFVGQVGGRWVLATAALTALADPTAAYAEVFLRGAHNAWQAEPMLAQGYYQAQDIVTFDNMCGFNPGSSVMKGHLDRDGNNIQVDCGQTYYIEMSYFGDWRPDNTPRSGLYGLRPINATIPSELAPDGVAAFRKAIRGGGFYGAKNIIGEVLIRPLGEAQSVVVRAKRANTFEILSVDAELKKTLPNGLQIWGFAVGTYGDLDLESITYRSGDTNHDVAIEDELVQ